jgi:pyruvate ferredoxin oxidoreductase alpha subunit
MAYRIAEDEKIRLPVIINLDGFYLSFTREPVELPDKETVDAFIPPFDAKNIKLRASMPESQAVAVLGGSPYSYFRYEMHLAAMNGLNVYESVAADFKRHFGREYTSVESYRTDDAEYLFVMMGSFATKAKEAVERLRDTGWKIGLLRPRLFRPFPASSFQKLCLGKKAIAVIDQNLSMGKGGVLHCELASALYGHDDMPKILASFIGGLGGRDISTEEFFEMANVIKRSFDEGSTPQPRLLYTDDELREIRKLQTIANVERSELGGEQ